MPDHCPTIARDGQQVVILDQTCLPWTERFVRLDTLADADIAIRDMQVRGAPLIGATAAYGLATALDFEASDTRLSEVVAVLGATRPTAVNLHWALGYGSYGGKDLVGKWGYKKSIVYGLLFSALGAAAMIVAVNANTFAGMLVGLFIVALGFSLQQTAAQPFAISLGDPNTGTSRVNLGGGINSFGTSIWPLIVALALFGTTAAVSDEQIAALSLGKVITLYLAVGALFILAAALFHFAKKVPSGIMEEKSEKANKALYTLLIMTGLLIIVFVPVFGSYKTDLTNATEDARHAMEQYRMKWLLGALAIVVVGLVRLHCWKRWHIHQLNFYRQRLTCLLLCSYQIQL